MSEAARWSYRTGSWFAVFGPQTTLLLPADQKDRVVGLWSGIDDGADFSTVLDGLLASGLSGIRAFALVGGDAASTRVLVRGEGVHAVLTGADGEVTVDGSGASTWSEQTVADVTACRVVLPSDEAESGVDGGVDGSGDIGDAGGTGDEDAVDHTVVTGLVRVGRIDRPPYVAPVAAPEPEPEPDVAAAVVTPDADVDADVDAGAVPEPDAEVVAPGVVDGPGDPVTEPEPDLGPPTEHLAFSDLPEADAEPTSDDVAPVTDAERDLASETPVELDKSDEPTDGVDEPQPDPLSDPLTDSQAAEVHDAPTPAEPAVEPAVESAAEPASEAGAPVIDDEGWMSPPSGPPAPAAPPAEPSADAPPPFAPPPLPVGSWASPDSAPAPADAPGTDHDGLTRTGTVDESEFARQQPGIPGQPPAPAITRAVAKLLISDGETVEIDRVVLIGRAPEARRFTSTEQPMLVTVPSPLHEISSTHVEVRPGTGADHGSAVVTDMGSTNGTVLAQPGLPPEDLKPGIAVQLIPGAIINLGDGVTIQVTRP